MWLLKRSTVCQEAPEGTDLICAKLLKGPLDSFLLGPCRHDFRVGHNNADQKGLQNPPENTVRTQAFRVLVCGLALKLISWYFQTPPFPKNKSSIMKHLSRGYKTHPPGCHTVLADRFWHGAAPLGCHIVLGDRFWHGAAQWLSIWLVCLRHGFKL